MNMFEENINILFLGVDEEKVKQGWFKTSFMVQAKQFTKGV